MQSMLTYLVRHSDAMDTADGIRQWWLPLDCTFSREEVLTALDELVARKWLITRGARDELRLYGLNKERLGEVMQFISGRPGDAKETVH